MSLRHLKKRWFHLTKDKIQELAHQLASADGVVIGAGAGLSASAGMTYAGQRFEAVFSDFIAKYHFSDMYSGGFYPFPSLEEYWAYWSRYIWLNRYQDVPMPVYGDLLRLVEDNDYFVLTTNVDHCFQRAGFDKRRLFYTQGDYGLWQCATPCHSKTYENEAVVRRMRAEQADMRVPTELVPYCPLCGKPMTMNLRCDATFVQNEGWYQANGRYRDFLRRQEGKHVLFWELGVGDNTPDIIKYPFWQMTNQNTNAVYACINLAEVPVPSQLSGRSISIVGDIGQALRLLRKERGL